MTTSPSTPNTSGLLAALPTTSKTGWPWDTEVSPLAYDASIDYPTLSIVTPSFNQGEFIEETMRSILLQNYPKLEFIVMDGGSTDHTVELLKTYAPWITYWVSEKDNGQSHAINKGFLRVTGDLFNWLNSDDFYTMGALEKIGKAYAQHRSQVITGVVNNFNPTQQWSSRTPVGNDTFLFSKAKIDQPATFFSTSAFRHIGPLDQSLHLVMDLDIWIKFLLVYGPEAITSLEDTLVNFRFHIDSKSTMQQDKMLLDRIRLLHELQLSFDSTTHRYSALTPHATHRQTDIVKGITDFMLYQTMALLKKKSPLAKEALSCISFKKLSLTHRIKLGLRLWFNK